MINAKSPITPINYKINLKEIKNLDKKVVSFPVQNSENVESNFNFPVTNHNTDRIIENDGTQRNNLYETGGFADMMQKKTFDATNNRETKISNKLYYIKENKNPTFNLENKNDYVLNKSYSQQQYNLINKENRKVFLNTKPLYLNSLGKDTIEFEEIESHRDEKLNKQKTVFGDIKRVALSIDFNTNSNNYITNENKKVSHVRNLSSKDNNDISKSIYFTKYNKDNYNNQKLSVFGKNIENYKQKSQQTSSDFSSANNTIFIGKKQPNYINGDFMNKITISEQNENQNPLQYSFQNKVLLNSNSNSNIFNKNRDLNKFLNKDENKGESNTIVYTERCKKNNIINQENIQDFKHFNKYKHLFTDSSLATHENIKNKGPESTKNSCLSYVEIQESNEYRHNLQSQKIISKMEEYNNQFKD